MIAELMVFGLYGGLMMALKEVKNKFAECDFCGAKTDFLKDDKLPSGWVSTYTMYKVDNFEKTYKDFHFCSREHFIEFIKKSVNDTSDTRRLDDGMIQSINGGV